MNVIAFFEDDKDHYFVVTELLTGGELFSAIVARSKFTEREARGVMTVLLQAVAFCHEHNVVHRDIKVRPSGDRSPHTPTHASICSSCNGRPQTVGHAHIARHI